MVKAPDSATELYTEEDKCDAIKYAFHVPVNGQGSLPSESLPRVTLPTVGWDSQEVASWSSEQMYFQFAHGEGRADGFVSARHNPIHAFKPGIPSGYAKSISISCPASK
jgi:hypothetical protein